MSSANTNLSTPLEIVTTTRDNSDKLHMICMNLIKGLFRIIIFSSNDPYFLEERPGYYICKAEKGLELVPAVPKSAIGDVCENDSILYIPKSKADFVRVMDTLDTTNLSRPFRPRIRSPA